MTSRGPEEKKTGEAPDYSDDDKETKQRPIKRKRGSNLPETEISFTDSAEEFNVFE